MSARNCDMQEARHNGSRYMRILVVEDDRKTADYVVKGLSEAGHVCDLLSEGRDALFQATRETYDLAVVDRMLPGLDGLSLVKALRAAGVKTPVLFLTAIGGVDDRVEGLEAGGDDYLVKPFAFSELLARANALARRPPVQDQKTVLRVADLELDLVKRRVTRQGQLLDLQPREFLLLEILMRNEGRVLTRTMLLERVWDLHFDPKTSVVETHISRLRGKIDKPFETALLHTVRNTGYSLHAPH
jgi:two-component system, OmpR family, response regulator